MSLLRNKMKLFTIITVILFVSSLCLTSYIIFASKSSLKELNPGERYLTGDETNEVVNSKEYKIAKEKTKKRLEDAWNDIANVFNITEDNYTKLTTDDLSTGVEKVNSQFADREFKRELSKVYRDMGKKMKIGFIKPIAFVKNDGTEIIFGSKDEDGNIMIVKSKKMENTWVRTVENKKGKAPLKMEDIKVQ